MHGCLWNNTTERRSDLINNKPPNSNIRAGRQFKTRQPDSVQQDSKDQFAKREKVPSQRESAQIRRKVLERVKARVLSSRPGGEQTTPVRAPCYSNTSRTTNNDDSSTPPREPLILQVWKLAPMRVWSSTSQYLCSQLQQQR
ncbi:hypothetical protein WN51_03632 [Melipona quadrifasciata]|uniref:Uncharacterized protein n=1 Tax=Melipona quadrifasciata TaxID=166423 RepID=A0A0N1ITE6_9HYME|nr:hypothetical protein WN51_03632 [Melipona quadrifasciata]